VQDKQGTVTLVSAGDLLGAESFQVTKTFAGCIVISGRGSGDFSLRGTAPKCRRHEVAYRGARARRLRP